MRASASAPVASVDCEIRIAREPGLCSNGDGEAANERERDVGSGEIGPDLAECDFERCHRNLALMFTNFKGAPNFTRGGNFRMQHSRQVCATTVAVTQNPLLAEPSDIDHIAATIRKIQAHGAQLART